MERRRIDRLSPLPDHLIHRILSFLPIIDVVSTGRISKRFVDLWTTVPCLNLCDISDHLVWEESADDIRHFVNRALMLWNGGEIQKFKLEFDWITEPIAMGIDIDLWVRFAVKNKVKELSIILWFNVEYLEIESVDETEKELYLAPRRLNSCKWIRELSLVGCNLQIPEPPSWDELKSLKIDGYCFSEGLISRILSGSPQLEVFELYLVDTDDQNLTIQSRSLKILKIEKFLFPHTDEPSDDTGVTINCPNLEILALSGVLYSRYLIINVSSVTDVTLGFKGSYCYGRGNELVEETLRQIFSNFRHVHKVTLSYWCVQVLGVLLSISNVELFANLGMLVITDPSRYSSDEFDASKDLEFEEELFDASKYLGFEGKLSEPFMLQLKTVAITLFSCEESTIRFIEFLWKDAAMLEELVIRSYDSAHLSNVKKRLLSMRKSSPTAKLTTKSR